VLKGTTDVMVIFTPAVLGGCMEGEVLDSSIVIVDNGRKSAD